MRFWRGFFLAAGLFNLLGGAAGFFSIDGQFRQMGLPPPVYPFSFQLLFVFVMILGVAYLVVARDPPRHRDLIWIGLATKISGLGMTYWAIASGQLPVSAWWQPLVNDLVWAVGFGAFLAGDPRKPRS